MKDFVHVWVPQGGHRTHHNAIALPVDVPAIPAETKMRQPSSSSSEDGEGFSDREDEEVDLARCLFCESKLEGVGKVWGHMKMEHGFDFWKYLRPVARDLGSEYGRIVLVNFMRRRQMAGEDMREVVLTELVEDGKWWKDESLFLPADPSDILLWGDVDGVGNDGNCENGDDQNPEAIPLVAAGSDMPVVVSELSVEEENAKLHEVVKGLQARLREALIGTRGNGDDDDDPQGGSCHHHGPGLSSRRSTDDRLSPPNSSGGRATPTGQLDTPAISHDNAVSVAAKNDSSQSSSALSRGARNTMMRLGHLEGLSQRTDDGYFDGYGKLGIHREMILDRIRTNAYRNFILRNKSIFENKIVLDVGCGTGVLSLFCAQAGAKMVVGIDAAAETLKVARRIVSANELTVGGRVQLVEGKLENIKLMLNAKSGELLVIRNASENPPVDAQPLEVDFIVSEWMGYGLLYESMIYSVLYARDQYLKPSGLMVPSKASLLLDAADFSREISAFVDPWRDDRLFGLNLSAVGTTESEFITKPLVDVVPPAWLRSSKENRIATMDLKTVTAEEVRSLRIPFSVKLLNNTCQRIEEASDSKASECVPQATSNAVLQRFVYGQNLVDTPHDSNDGHDDNREKVATSLVLSFDCAFEPCLNPLPASIVYGPQAKEEVPDGTEVLSTDPRHSQTHWAQSVFHLKESESGSRLLLPTTVVNEGRENSKTLKGFLSIAPHAEAPRCLGVAVELDEMTALLPAPDNRAIAEMKEVVVPSHILYYDFK